MAHLIINNRTIRSYCKENGVSYPYVYNRLKEGNTLEEAIEKYKVRRKSLKHIYKGQPVVEVFKHDRRAYSRFLFRMKEGWKLEDAVEFDFEKYGRK